jgi:hypothetical protein
MRIRLEKNRFIFLVIIALSVACSCDSNLPKSAQDKNVHCACENQEFVYPNREFCDTIVLSDAAKLYWSFNCDRIWLTLENRNRQRFVIDDFSIESMPLIHRIGSSFIKDFDETILIQHDCAATGPCSYSLIEKVTGNVVKKFPQLIGIDWENKTYNFDFVASLSQESDEIEVYFPNEKKAFAIAISNLNRKSAYPEDAFIETTFFGDVLTFKYLSDLDEVVEINVSMEQAIHSSYNGL